MKDLKREIDGTNILNSFAKKAIAKVLPQLVPFLEKKIFLADGSKAKNFIIDLTDLVVDKMDGASCSMVQNCYIDTAYNKLILVVNLCHNGGSYDVQPTTGWTKYTKQSFELGVCRGNQILCEIFKLDEIVEKHKLDEVLNFDDELAKIKQFRYLEAKASEMCSTIKVGQEFYKYL